jgi:hypothetical protein
MAPGWRSQLRGRLRVTGLRWAQAGQSDCGRHRLCRGHRIGDSIPIAGVPVTVRNIRHANGSLRVVRPELRFGRISCCASTRPPTDVQPQCSHPAGRFTDA